MTQAAAKKKRVLFICTYNIARSQMAEGLLRAYHGDDYEAFSAGREPATLNPLCVKAMVEIGSERLQTLPMSLRLIKEIHAILLET